MSQRPAYSWPRHGDSWERSQRDTFTQVRPLVLCERSQRPREGLVFATPDPTHAQSGATPSQRPREGLVFATEPSCLGGTVHRRRNAHAKALYSRPRPNIHAHPLDPRTSQRPREGLVFATISRRCRLDRSWSQRPREGLVFATPSLALTFCGLTCGHNAHAKALYSRLAGDSCRMGWGPDVATPTRRPCIRDTTSAAINGPETPSQRPREGLVFANGG